jgi:hypothetical protein
MVMKPAIIFVFIIFSSIFVGGAASAAPPMRVEGRNCTVADSGSETWYGFFKGQRDVFSPLKGGGVANEFSKWRCFAAEIECDAWKYWMQVDFPEGGNEAFCRQGG